MKDSELALSIQEIEIFFKLLEKNIGISLSANKSYLIHARLNALAKENDFGHAEALVRQLCANPLSPLHWQAFDAMTTNETSFFRDTHPFEALKKFVIPQLIKKKSDSKQIRIWCAAASTGQEPYSMAMLLREHFPEVSGWTVTIHATDISETALNKARAGVFNSAEIRRGLSEEQIRRHFFSLDNGSFQIKSDLKNTITFSQLNLVKDWPVMPKFDLILIRNVLIYFNESTKQALMKKIHAQLAGRDATLLLGSSESILFDPNYQICQLERVAFYRQK
jgi:chemotaxis protein methyltransferase CheR